MKKNTMKTCILSWRDESIVFSKIFDTIWMIFGLFKWNHSLLFIWSSWIVEFVICVVRCWAIKSTLFEVCIMEKLSTTGPFISNQWFGQAYSQLQYHALSPFVSFFTFYEKASFSHCYASWYFAMLAAVTSTTFIQSV